MKFYDIDEAYIDYLKTIDRQVPDIKYTSNNKFVCGVVLDINSIMYYAPISHLTKKQQTNLQILNKGKAIATIRFSFMFPAPAPASVLHIKDFAKIAKTDQAYADLLAAEYKWCDGNKEDIYKKAASVYKIGCNKNHVLNYTCCDFNLLEQKYSNYLASNEAAPTIEE